ncbi:MAG: zf-HC2 domain-containing protein [Deltaproteobacteria bacterium]|nr:zf-HC2 domain-containing protein [Deltaproteobacteria bacterium]
MTGWDRYSPEACKDFGEDLILYYYGEWQGTERDRVEVHIKDCARCESFLEELSRLLPLSHDTDEPPEAFWEQYSIEMHQKLAALEEKRPWWNSLFDRITPWTYGAVATAFGLILSLVLAFSGGKWLQRYSSEDRLPQEIQSVSGELEFFKTMELMEVLELLEGVGQSNHERKSA